MKRPPSIAGRVTVAVLATVTLSGCSMFHSSTDGSGSAPAVIAPSSSGAATAAAVKPSAVRPMATAPENAPAAPTVPGYTLTTASPVVLHKFEAVAGQFRGVYSGLTVRTVMRGTQQAGTVVLLGLHPELVGNTQVEQRLVPGMVKGMSGRGANVATERINNVDVAVATTKTTSIVAWYRTGTVVLMLADGGDAAPSVAFSRAYLAAK